MKTAVTLSLILLLLHAGASLGEDIDVFRAQIKNTAMMVFDTSGSMSVPVYDPGINYALFMKKMAESGAAMDENHCRNGLTWWDKDGAGNDYDRLDPDGIYLVGTWSDATHVSYLDSLGTTHHALVTGDILKNTGSETDPLENKRYPLLTGSIIPVKNAAGNPWRVSSSDTINSDSEGHVVFPGMNLADTEGREVVVPRHLRQSRLPGPRDIRVIKIDRNPATGEYRQSGFSGTLQSAGFYVSGLYQKAGSVLQATDNVNQAESRFGEKKVLLFATGNWLNFIKLVEDFRIGESFYPCANDGAYPHQKYKAWRYACSQGGAAPVRLPCNERNTAGEACLWKIQSRLDVAKSSAKTILSGTGGRVNWGLTVLNGADGGRTAALPETGTDSIISIIEALEAQGACPIGEAVQDAYQTNYSYLFSHHERSQCSSHYIVLFSAGFPSEDNDWQRIGNDERAEFRSAPVFGSCENGYDARSPTYGDSDVWPPENHSDDLAHWLYHEAGYRHSVMPVGFNFESPMLEDIADSSSGIYIRAGYEQEVISVLKRNGFGLYTGSSYSAPATLVGHAGRTTNGDVVYAAFFEPERDSYWKGNLKKYGLTSMNGRDDCGRSEPESLLVDRHGNPAVSCDGTLNPASTSLWSRSPDGGSVASGGAGALLKERIDGIDMEYGPYYDFRNIYTCKNPDVSRELVRFWRDGDSSIADAIQPSDLGLRGGTKADFLKRDQIINHIYGYTFTALDSGHISYSEERDGAPLSRREWILGDIIHSEPCVIDYLDQNRNPEYRFIAVGANDGMLHVFADSVSPENPNAPIIIGNQTYRPGDEIWAFIPGDLLPQLKQFEMPDRHTYFVDGSCSLHVSRTRRNGDYHDKVLIFGERRGGRSYWALDVSRPNPLEWSVKWRVNGGTSPNDFSGHLGYTWPKPVTARITTGAQTETDVVILSGGYDPEEDFFPEPWVDGNNDGIYSPGNPEDIFDISDIRYDAHDNDRYDVYNPEKNEIGCGLFIVRIADGSPVFKVTYGAHDSSVGSAQTYSEMSYCFPSDPSVVELSGSLIIYTADIYGNIWKVDYIASRSEKWEVKKIFMSNPGSTQTGAMEAVSGNRPSLDISDRGRKMFYSPDISLGGNDWSRRPVLYFGTGDRSHPNYIPGYHNRFYVVSDTGTTANETDLLNLTCDELDSNADTNQNSILETGGFQTDADLSARNALYTILNGNRNYPDSTSVCRGWYRVLGLQGECTQGQTVNHLGEICVNRPVLFNRVVYFTTFQPNRTSPCTVGGNAFIYALDYSHGTGAFNMNADNSASALADEGMIEDTYQLIENSTIPTAIRVINSPSGVSAFAGAGNKFAGAGAEPAAGEGHSAAIPSPPGGIIRLLWESN